MKKIYDTCSLLKALNFISEPFLITSITIEELENIKTSAHKDEKTKYLAREAVRFLEQNQHLYQVIIYTTLCENIISNLFLPLNNDNKIMACCLEYQRQKQEEVVFVTNDLCAKTVAENIFKLKTEYYVAPQEEQYTGYLEIYPTDEELAELYSGDRSNNIFNALTNQYIILKSPTEKILDILCWTGKVYRNIHYRPFDSSHFGLVTPIKGDVYQQCLFDSLCHNEITLIGGNAGTGKTAISFAYLFSQLESGVIDRIVVFCNPVVAKNAAKLGFYPGTPNEKLLSSQVGAILSSKLGGDLPVQRLIDTGKLILVPAGDARGYEVPQHSGVYIMEAQNLDVTLLKLLLQRIGKKCVTIVDGDRFTQTDMSAYEENNGMKKMSEIFKGEDIFGQVDLQNIYRSKIAKIAEKMGG